MIDEIQIAAPRWSVRATVSTVGAVTRARWQAVNISNSGMFVVGRPLLPPGALVDFEAELPSPDGLSVDLVGRLQVVWTRPDGAASYERPTGMGVKFIGLPEHARAELRDYLNEIAQAQLASGAACAASQLGEPLSPQSPAKVGDRLGSYTLVRLLGAGGVGQVFLAHHVLLGRRVALKVLRGELAADGLAVRRFFDEARIINQIQHEHVVQVSDLVVDAGRVFFVMELVEGQTLGEVLCASGPLPVGRAVSIGLQIADALGAVHRAGVVHRDLKPANIMLVGEGEQADFVKLLDFGTARLGRSKAPLTPPSPNLMGTPGFVAPELLAGGVSDARADIYAFGVVLFNMLTGKMPLGGQSSEEMLLRQLAEKPPRPSRLARRPIPRALDQLVEQCLALSAERRPASMDAVQAVLERLDV